MSPIEASAVSRLRVRTGVSILACKEALEEAGGNEERAIEILRKRGIAQAVKKAERTQAEGALFIVQNASKAVIVGLKCETDFVARHSDFIALGQALQEKALSGGKPALDAEASRLLPDAVQKLGENISLREMQEIDAPVIGSYVHSNRKIAVVVGLDSGTSGAAKDVAMHAAALNPLYVSPEHVPADTIAKEREIWKEQMKQEKKPPEILEKIMLGKEKKFKEENSLIKQPFVKDSSKTVEQYLGGARITAYVRVAI